MRFYPPPLSFSPPLIPSIGLILFWPMLGIPLVGSTSPNSDVCMCGEERRTEPISYAVRALWLITTQTSHWVFTTTLLSFIPIISDEKKVKANPISKPYK